MIYAITPFNYENKYGVFVDEFKHGKDYTQMAKDRLAPYHFAGTHFTHFLKVYETSVGCPLEYAEDLMFQDGCLAILLHLNWHSGCNVYDPRNPSKKFVLVMAEWERYDRNVFILHYRDINATTVYGSKYSCKFTVSKRYFMHVHNEVKKQGFLIS